ncbi:aspartate/glutamate racemase family protein [Chitinimonas sp.]|uniref:aspartate/glutamate racemase family protein n=1 Tax=Chitinimonas sp. TaxID=1934313 RepID=UPI0035AF3428
MKTLGLIGGMSWESTVSYYRLINEGIKQRLGGLHSAKLLLSSVDFATIAELQRAGDWDEAGRQLAEEARRLQGAGAELLVLATNTMHLVAPAIEAATAIPLLHIVDPTGAALRAASIDCVGLLGTRFTMEQDFYRGRLESMHGLRVITPAQPARERVHQVIFDELCLGRIEEDSRRDYLDIVAQLQAAGAQAVILGCTEIGLLLRQSDCALPLFDTTALHAQAAVDAMLA